jgi:hypothetical protein
MQATLQQLSLLNDDVIVESNRMAQSLGVGVGGRE